MVEIDKRSALWYRCKEHIEKQAAGEWYEDTIIQDAENLYIFVKEEIADATKS